MDRDSHETLEERLLHRLLFFSDAVFAIVLTLLVLELKPPEGLAEGDRTAALGEMLGPFFSFAMSFALVAIFWLAHMSTTSVLRRFDWPTTVANFAFLFPICLIPFASAWFGGGLNDALTWSVYCLVLVATSAGNVALVLVTSRDKGRLVGGLSGRQRIRRAIRAASPGMAFALGLVLLAFGELRISQYCWLTIGPFLWLEGRFFPAEPAPQPARPSVRRRRLR